MMEGVLSLAPWPEIVHSPSAQSLLFYPRRRVKSYCQGTSTIFTLLFLLETVLMRAYYFG